MTGSRGDVQCRLGAREEVGRRRRRVNRWWEEMVSVHDTKNSHSTGKSPFWFSLGEGKEASTLFISSVL